MKIVIQKTPLAASERVAEIIASELRAKPALTLGMATGNTMLPLYKILVSRYEKGELDFSLCRTFNLDEYAGLEKTDKQSYHYYMREHLFDKINIKKANTHLPDGMASDLEAACRAYERLIQAAGGIDLQLLGIGENGHIGFNEPFASFNSRTRVQVLTAATIAQNSPLFDSPDLMPKTALTMGIGTILEGRRCVMLVTGANKAPVIAQAIDGPVTTAIPASVLQNHPACTIVMDEAAASALKDRQAAEE